MNADYRFPALCRAFEFWAALQRWHDALAESMCNPDDCSSDIKTEILRRELAVDRIAAK